VVSVWYVCERSVWGEHGVWSVGECGNVRLCQRGSVWSVGECGVWSVGGCERGL